MAGVLYLASTSFTDGNGTSISGVAKPAGTAIGTCLLFQVYIEDEGTHGAYTIASTGDTWTLVNNVTNTGATPDFGLHVWRCIVGNPTSTISVTWDGDSAWRDCAVHAFSGVDPNTPEDCASTANSGSGTAETGLEVTTVTNRAHLVMLSSNFDGNARSSWTSGLTERNDSGNVAMAEGVQATAGASGAKANTISSSQWATVLMALRPALGVINFTGFETGDATEIYAAGGTYSIQSSVARTGTYALRLNPSAGAGYALTGQPFSGKNSTITFFAGEHFETRYLWFTSLPAADSTIMGFTNGGGSSVVAVKCDASGNITLVGTSTSGTIATVTTGQWYRFDLRGISNGTCGLSIDGGSETTVTGNNVALQLVLAGSITSATFDIVFDDCVTSDLGFVTTPEVKISLPIGAGTYTEWLDSGTTYAEVDDVPPDGNTSFLFEAFGSNAAHTFDMQSVATAGVTGDILAVKPIAIIRENTSSTTLGGVRLRSGSTNFDHTAVDIGNTTYVALQQVFSLDPNGWGAWDSTAFDAVEVGPFKGADASGIVATAVYLMALSEGGASPTDATVAGEEATATSAGLAGVVVAEIAVAVAGEEATSAAAGLAGTVTTVRNVLILGEEATAVAAGLAGVVAPQVVAAIAGALASASAAGLDGVLAAVRIASVPGEEAAATAAGLDGVAATVRIASVPGEEATADAAGLDGSIGAAVSATVAGEESTATASGVAGAIVAEIDATVAGEEAAASAAGLDGVVAAVRIASVPGEEGTATATGLDGVVAAVRIASVPGEEATADAAGLDGTITGGVVAGIAGEEAAASAAGLDGVVATVRIASVPGEEATASAAGLDGTIVAQIDATVAGEEATADAAGLDGEVTNAQVAAVAGEEATADAAGLDGVAAAVRIASVSGEEATATAAGLDGVLATVRNSTVSGEEATAVALGLAGAVAGTVSISVSGEPAAADAAGLDGVVAAIRIATILGALASADAVAHEGAVDSAGSRTIQGQKASAAAAGMAGAVEAQVVVTVAGELAAATAAGLAGAVSAQIATTVSGAMAEAVAEGSAGTVTTVEIVSIVGVAAGALAAGLVGRVSAMGFARATIVMTVRGSDVAEYEVLGQDGPETVRGSDVGGAVVRGR